MDNNEVKAYFEQLRADAELEHARRREHVYALEPFIKLDNARRDAIEQLTAAALSETANIEALRGSLDALKSREAHLLVECGFPEGYLNIDTLRKCGLCSDTGFVRSKDGAMRHCRCAKAYAASRHMEEAGLSFADGDTFANFDLDMFHDPAQRERMGKLREYVLRFCDDFPETDKRILVLLGETGVGKTFLLNCIAHKIIERGYSVICVSMYRLARDAFKQGAVSEQCLSADLLTIDDLGAEPRYGTFSAETLFNVINERMSAGRHTLFSSNLKTGELRDRYSERVYSRLFSKKEASAFELRGKDLRRN